MLAIGDKETILQFYNLKTPLVHRYERHHYFLFFNDESNYNELNGLIMNYVSNHSNDCYYIHVVLFVSGIPSYRHISILNVI